MKVLLVRLRLIGDVVFTTPLLGALRRHFPDAQLTYLVEPAAAPVVAHNPYLTDVIVVPHRRGLARLRDDARLAWSLRRRRFDLAIDLHGGPRAAWLTLASGAPRRIGYTIAGRSWMYTDVVPRSPDLTPRHSVANQWDLLTPLGVAPASAERDPVLMPEDGHAAAGIRRRLADAALEGHPLVVLHVSAGNPFRRWPAASFTQLIAQLVRNNPDRRVVVTSGPSESEAARRVADAARQQLGPLRAGVADIGDCTLAELRSLIAQAAVYIGGDSGPLHIAATTSTPVVAIFGPTLPERSMPWRSARWFSEAVDAGTLPCRPCDQRHCAPGDFRCLTSIAPERVLEAAERALALHASQGAPLRERAGDAMQAQAAGKVKR